jgi:hypothetical protein
MHAEVGAFPTPALDFSQSVVATIYCGQILLDPQGHFPYIFPRKNDPYITHPRSMVVCGIAYTLAV